MEIIINPSLRRICEVALIGNFEINLVVSTDNKKDLENAKESIKILRDKLNVKFSKNGILNYEYSSPTFKVDNFEPLSKIAMRVKKYKNRILKNTDISGSSESLIQTAIDKLDLNINQIKSIKNIAFNIAKLENSSEIAVFHVAEAIQYVNMSNENLISVFDNVISFGGIDINLCGLTKENIKDAIKFLTNY